MSHIIIRGMLCPFCGSDDIIYNPITETARCRGCGRPIDVARGMTYATVDEKPSSSQVAGTEPPPHIVGAETKELYLYQRERREIFPRDEIKKIERDIGELKNAITELDRKIEEVRGISPRVVIVEEVPKEDAKHRIEEYFKEHETADIEELMLNLKIPVQTIVEIIDELKEEGKISAEGEERT